VGDTWVFGVQSDPLKVADFRAVQRYRTACVADGACHLQDPAFANFSRLLMKVRGGCGCGSCAWFWLIVCWPQHLSDSPKHNAWPVLVLSAMMGSTHGRRAGPADA
jgi:hypothetical protein